MTVSPNLFWDSCIFIRYLTGIEESECFGDICKFIGEAKAGTRKIYFSTVTFAEIRQEYLKTGGYGSIREFFGDMGGSFIPIEPNPNVMIATGELRSAKSTNPGDPKATTSRVIGTPDAIILTTCLYARDVLGIADILFHTTDEGKGRSWEGKCVPLLKFEEWYPEATRTDRVREVCGLARSKPLHPEPTFEGMVIHGRFPQPKHGPSGQPIG